MTNLASAGVLVVGTGESGVRVAVALREFGYDRPIVLVGDEPHPPYQRPPPSKGFLDGTVDHDDLALRTAGFYRGRDIEVRSGRSITGVDAGTGTAWCAGHEAIAFEQLVLATGARARQLPVAGAGLDGVCTLRSLDDAVVLRERMATAERVVILGAGYIGLEAAAVASNRGLATTVVERECRLLSRVSSAPLSEFLLNRHRAWGVESVLGAEVRRAIVVDTAGRTSHPRVLAARECTVQPHPHLPGELIGMESVQNANDQARIAAATIAGVEPVTPPVPWFWSDQRDLKLQIAGISHG